jgi:uncharacterized protein
LSGRVVDTNGTLSEETRGTLEARLEALEKETGAQVAVLTVASLGGETVEDVSMQVVETWKLGRAEQDDGVLLLIAKDDRALRIEVGYGLEGALPDARARRIIDNVIVPQFKAGDFNAGVEAGVEEIAKAIRGEADTMPQAVLSTGDGTPLPFPAAVGLFLLFFTPFAWPAVAIRGFTGWFMLLFLSPFLLVFGGAFFGGAVAVPIALVWLIGGAIVRFLLPERLKMTASNTGGSGWSSGGGGWSSGGGGGGGFSGGGGSFGGGGSSGSW